MRMGSFMHGRGKVSLTTSFSLSKATTIPFDLNGFLELAGPVAMGIMIPIFPSTQLDGEMVVKLSPRDLGVGFVNMGYSASVISSSRPDEQ